jgi:outer membrane protein OmpA-like peptidoglycan-associated protein/sugar lactone lactonase YvrE
MRSYHFYAIIAFCVLQFYSIVLSSQNVSDKVRIKVLSLASSDSRIRNVKILDDNFIWIASSNGLIQSENNGNLIKVHFENTEIVDIISDNKGRIWAASLNSLYNLSDGTEYTLDHPVASIKGITYLKGSIWIGTNTGLFQFNTTSLKYKLHDTKNSKLASNLINFVHADRHNILWIGTSKGYIRIENDKWELQDKNYQMLATCENDEGQWIVTQEDMFLINKYNRLFPVNLDKSQYKGKINSFVIDSKGKIYIASDILSCYDPYSEKVENYSDDASILSKATLSLGCDKKDNIWVGTAGAGLYKLSFDESNDGKLNTTCIIQSPIKCFGEKNGSMKVSVQGGKPPYRYLWQNEETTDIIKNLEAGTYSVTVIDQDNNTSIATANLSQPRMITITNIENSQVNNPSNPDGKISINVHGGTSPYLYDWSNKQKSKNINDLSAGLYTVTVTDKNGCTGTGDFLVKREKYIPDLEISKVTIGQKLRINELNFLADSSNITTENYDILDEVFIFLHANISVVVEIGGHTNTIPPHEYCDQLSAARAKGIAEYLIKRGIDPNRVSYKGYGKREPLTDSESLQGRQRNQRVEIKILQM